MDGQLNKILAAAQADIKAAEDQNLDELRTKYLGRKAELSLLLRQIKDLPMPDRARLGRLGNEVKTKIEELFDARSGSATVAEVSNFDPTIPGIPPQYGHLHPITQTQDQLVEVFRNLGFDVADGPEIETEEYNFNLLNIPANHPARDQWDTFWIKRSSDGANSLLLRTHTSPVQIRYMQNHKPPLRVIAPGRTFRFEAEDATHGSTFNQFEGLLIDKDISISHLKATLRTMLENILGTDIKLRLRPSYFPFTEPSFEVDVWFREKWLELGGAGMVNPIVLKNCGINPDEYSGFAFGMGIDRIAMIKYNIPDVRYLLSGNLNFLEQF